ncbi:MAG: universal stress protein [Verrucomicrobia bacterium]|nr:universal stress protein [Verrucomicrobiota bacterium]
MKIKRASKPGAVVVELGRQDAQLLAQASPLKLKHILVPIDFSDCSKKALRYAVAMAEQFGARITLLYVTETVAMPTEFGYAPADAGMAVAATAQKALEDMAQVVEPELGRSGGVQAIVRTGVPWQEITTTAEAADVDLIILSTHGYTGVSRVFLGSTAERVVRRAACPVLVVREREREFVSTNRQRPKGKAAS